MTKLPAKLPLILFYAFLLSACVIVTSCSHLAERTLPMQDTEGLLTYSASNIHGYKNAPIYVDSQFVGSMNLINEYARENGVEVIVTSSFRMEGRKIKGAIVAPAKMSNHLTGHAIDMNVLYNKTLYESKDLKLQHLPYLPKNVVYFIRDIRANPSLRWGGDFKTEDPVHIDDALNKYPTEWRYRYDVCQDQASVIWH